MKYIALVAIAIALATTTADATAGGFASWEIGATYELSGNYNGGFIVVAARILANGTIEIDDDGPDPVTGALEATDTLTMVPGNPHHYSGAHDLTFDPTTASYGLDNFDVEIEKKDEQFWNAT